MIDRRKYDEVEKKANYKNLNKYDIFYEKAKKYVNYKIRIDTIYEYLLNNVEYKDFRKIVGKIEEIVYEGRKV